MVTPLSDMHKALLRLTERRDGVRQAGSLSAASADDGNVPCIGSSHSSCSCLDGARKRAAHSNGSKVAPPDYGMARLYGAELSQAPNLRRTAWSASAMIILLLFSLLTTTAPFVSGNVIRGVAGSIPYGSTINTVYSWLPPHGAFALSKMFEFLCSDRLHVSSIMVAVRPTALR